MKLTRPYTYICNANVCFERFFLIRMTDGMNKDLEAISSTAKQSPKSSDSKLRGSATAKWDDSIVMRAAIRAQKSPNANRCCVPAPYVLLLGHFPLSQHSSRNSIYSYDSVVPCPPIKPGWHLSTSPATRPASMRLLTSSM